MPNKKQHAGLNMNGYKVTGLPAPSAPSDAATKEWVEQNAGGSPQASNVTFTAPEGFPTTPNATSADVQKAIENLFTYANSGKNNVADSIGYETPYSDTFATLAGNIDDAKTKLATFLPNAEQTVLSSDKLHELANKLDEVRVFKQSAKLNKAQNSTSTFDLKRVNGSFPAKDKICVMPMVRINNVTNTETVATFNNGTESSFQPNEFIEFTSGVARLKVDYTRTLENTAVSGVKQVTIDLTDFQTFAVTSITSSTIVFRAIPIDQVLIPTEPIPINGVLDITSVTGTVGSNTYPFSTSVSFPVVAVQCGDNQPYYGFDSSTSTWQQIDINNTADFSAKGNLNLSSFNMENFEQLRNLPGNNPNQIRFAYLFIILVNNFGVPVLLSQSDNINLNVVMSGSFVPANETGAASNPPTVDYNQGDGKLTITYKQPGYDSYIINYLDKP